MAKIVYLGRTSPALRTFFDRSLDSKGDHSSYWEHVVAAIILIGIRNKRNYIR